VVLAIALAPWLYADEPQGDRNGLGDLNLTQEQETKIADIRKECMPKVQAAAKELAGIIRDEKEKVKNVLTPEQQAKVETMREERREQRVEGLAQKLAHLQELKDLDLTDAEDAKIADIRKECAPKIASALSGLHGILTDEQKKMRQEGLAAGKSRREVLQSLNLTDEQKQKLHQIGQTVRGIVCEELQQMKAVLTPEQQQKLGDIREQRAEHVRDRFAHRIANFESLNLTDEQKTKIADVRKECRPGLHEAGDKLRAAIREEVDMMMAVLKG
jgi:Spy/CpxP family protein refolding chaperone